jgi:hypothetical protein
MLKGLSASLLLLALVTGCGGGSGNSAPQKCDSLVSLLCTRVVECFNDGTTQAQCVDAVKTNLPCADADAVSSTYDSCVSEVQSGSCTVLFPNGNSISLPTTCMGVILFNQ